MNLVHRTLRARAQVLFRTQISHAFDTSDHAARTEICQCKQGGAAIVEPHYKFMNPGDCTW